MEDPRIFTYDQVKAKSCTRVLVNAQIRPVNILGYNTLHLIILSFSPCSLQISATRSACILKSTPQHDLNQWPAGWLCCTEEEAKWQICLSLLSIHYLLKPVSLPAHPRQQMPRNRLLTPLLSPPSQFYSVPVFILRAGICADAKSAKGLYLPVKEKRNVKGSSTHQSTYRRKE